jgi:hypothetical protein
MSTDNTNQDQQLESIEISIEWNDDAWWAAWPVKGTLSIGSGPTPWSAIAAAISGIPQTEDWAQHLEAAIERAKAGTFRCPGCGVLRPAVTPKTLPWAFHCGNCRGEPEGEQSALVQS